MEDERNGCPEGAAIMTWSGEYVNPLEMAPSDVDGRTIANALAKMCRFNGHVHEFYSVAEHSVHVAGLVYARTGDETKALWGLLHDAPEVYLSDIPKPVKVYSDLGPEYRRLESGVMRHICDKYGLPCKCPPEVKAADREMVVAEAHYLLPVSREELERWGDLNPTIAISCWDWRTAAARFYGLMSNLGVA